MTAAPRRLRRFISSDTLPPPGHKIRLSSVETHHLGKIIRLEPGDTCLVTDGKGREAVAEVLSFLPDKTAEVLIRKVVVSPEDSRLSSLSLRVFQAVPRGLKWEYLIQKAQELGVESLCPLETERTVVKIPEKKQSVKLERWHKIAAEAAKQSGNVRLLKMFAPMSLKDAFREIPHGGTVALFHPAPGGVSYGEWVKGAEKMVRGRGAKKALHLFLGPEGGFSAKEVAMLGEQSRSSAWDFSQVRLGEHILKADTAFVAVVASLRLLL